MFIVINRLTVQPGTGNQLVERFSKSYGLEDQPGFLSFQLLEPVWKPGDEPGHEYLSMTTWQTREAFEVWLKSDSFKRAHQGADNSIFAGPPQVIGYEPRVQRPAADESLSKRKLGMKLAFVNKMGMKLVWLLAMLALTIMSFGCSEAEDQAGYAQAAEPAPSEVADRQTIIFTDDTGQQITLDEPAERIVAGASFAVELLMAIDHPPVLRPDVPERKIHPDAARQVPTLRVQHGTGPDIESVAAAEADLLILHANFAQFAPNIRRSLDVPVALFEITSIDDVAKKLELFGRITGHTEQADKRIAQLHEEVQQVTEGIPADGPHVLALFGTPEAFFAYRDTSYLGSMLRMLGAENVSSDDPAFQRMHSVAQLNLEQAIARDPDVILIVPHGPPPAVMGYLSAHPAWGQMRAVRSENVHLLDEVLFSANPGPRVAQAMAELKKLLYAESP